MSNVSRIAASVLLLYATILSAEERAKASPVVTAAGAGEKVRFLSPAGGVQIRVQVLSPGNNPIFDSAWKDGNLFDWAVEALAPGTYRCIVMVKDLDGDVSQKEFSIEQPGGGEALKVVGANAGNAKVTLLAHDGENGSIVSTSGDLSFRFGDFLAGKDREAMRLTTDGDLHVEGVIRARGVVFPDGTSLTTSGGTAGGAPTGPIIRLPGASVIGGLDSAKAKSLSAAGKLTPRPTFAPAFQFVVGDTGVNVGTTNPAYTLDVTGTINTASTYNIGTLRFAHNTGVNNTFLGISAGNVTMGGTANTAIGAITLSSNTTGNSNTAIGYGSLSVNNAGGANTSVGAGALASNTIGNNNIGIGYAALYSNGGGNSNTAVGYSALQNTTGSLNTAIGVSAGSNVTAGSSNIDIANSGVSGDTSTIRIGDVQTRTFIAGIRGRTTGADAIAVVIDSNGQLGTLLSSRRYKFDISDMSDSTDRLMRLRPVTFRYSSHGDNAPLQYGLIAEEVAEVYPDMVTRNKDGEVETVMYQFLAPMLLNEVQRQRKVIESLERRLEALEKRSQ